MKCGIVVLLISVTQHNMFNGLPKVHRYVSIYTNNCHINSSSSVLSVLLLSQLIHARCFILYYHASIFWTNWERAIVVRSGGTSRHIELTDPQILQQYSIYETLQGPRDVAFHISNKLTKTQPSQVIFNSLFYLLIHG